MPSAISPVSSAPVRPSSLGENIGRRAPWLDRRRLFAWHGWLGLNLGALLYLICISGTLAVFTPEIDRWLDPARRVTPPTGAASPEVLARDPAVWAAWTELAAAAHPGATIDSLSAPGHPRDPAVVYMNYGEADSRRVFIDPHRGIILGDRPYLDAKSFVRVFHKQFNISAYSGGFHGTWIVGAYGVILLGAAVTGMLAFPRWWRALIRVRLRAGARATWSDLHRFLGAWGLLVTLVIALTGIWYWAERIAMDAGLPTPGAVSAAAESSAGLEQSRPNLPLETLLRRAFAAYPNLRPTSVAPASGPGRPLVVHGNAEAVAVIATANHVAIDPITGAIVSLARAADLGPLDRVAVSIDPIHFGTFGGLATRLVWLLGGLALSLGILAGAILYAVRATRRAGPGPVRRSRAWWGSTVFTLLVVGFATACSIHFIAGGQMPATDLPAGRPAPGGVPGAVWAFVAATILVYVAPIFGWIRWIKW